MNSVDRILELMKEKGIKQAFIENLINSYRGKLTEWKKGKSTPTKEEIEIISEYFNVSSDWILCTSDIRSKIDDNKNNNSHIASLNDLQKSLLFYFDKLDNNSKLMLIGRAEHMAEMQEGKTLSETNGNIVLDDTGPIEAEKPQKVELRLYDITMSAKLGNFFIDGDIPYKIVEFDAEKVPPNTKYAIRVDGDSLESKIHNGAVLFIKAQEQLAHSNS